MSHRKSEVVFDRVFAGFVTLLFDREGPESVMQVS